MCTQNPSIGVAETGESLELAGQLSLAIPSNTVSNTKMKEMEKDI